jgi:hypothetical protein
MAGLGSLACACPAPAAPLALRTLFNAPATPETPPIAVACPPASGTSSDDLAPRPTEHRTPIQIVHIPTSLVGMDAKEDTMIVSRSQNGPCWSVEHYDYAQDVLFLIADDIDRASAIRVARQYGEEKGFRILYLEDE